MQPRYRVAVVAICFVVALAINGWGLRASVKSRQRLAVCASFAVAVAGTYLAMGG
jgi:hypothetical protein